MSQSDSDFAYNLSEGSDSSSDVAPPVVDAPDEDGMQCRVDSDCVPASCCHASECMNSRFELDCTGVMCTMHCAPGTVDCGGGCACVDGRCEVYSVI